MIPFSPFFRILLFVAVFVMTHDLFAQQYANVTDSLGKKQGWWRKADSNGIRIYEGRFVDDIPLDTFLYYYPDGKRKARVVFSDNGRITRTVSWFPNGLLMATGKYNDRQRDSLWQYFSEIDGTLISEEWYRAGEKQGVETVYYAGKDTIETITWEAGQKEGPWIQYYRNGKVKLRTQLLHGERDGLFKTFYENGAICVTGNYSNGLKTGTWIYYDTEGNVTLREHYLNGTLQTSETP